MHIFPIHEQYVKYFSVLRTLYNSSMIKHRKISSVSFSKMEVNIVIFITTVNLFPDTCFYLLLFMFVGTWPKTFPVGHADWTPDVIVWRENICAGTM